jgi:hypothetical protein
MATIAIPKAPFVKRITLSKLRPKKTSISTNSNRDTKKSPAKKIIIRFKPVTPAKTAPPKAGPKVVHPDDEMFLLSGTRKILIFSTECLRKRATERAAAFKEALEQLELERYRAPISYAISRFLESNERGGKA